MATLQRPPIQPRPMSLYDGEGSKSSASMSTRELQAFYRQSQGASAFYDQYILPPIPQPWVQSNRARQSRVNSWCSDLSRSEIAEEQAEYLMPEPGRITSRHSTYSLPKPRPAKSTPSFEFMPSSIGGLDLSDPWGHSWEASSPYDALLPPKPASSGISPSNSSSRLSIAASTHSSTPSVRSGRSPGLSSDTSTAPTSAASSSSMYKVSPPLRSETLLPIQNHQIPAPKPIEVGLEPPRPILRQVASLNDLPSGHSSSGKNVGHSKLRDVRNSEEQLEAVQRKQRKFNWFRSLSKNSSKENASLQPKKSLAPIDTTRNDLTPAKGLPIAAEHLRTPQLSESTSSRASSYLSPSVDTNAETASTAATSLLESQEGASPKLSSEMPLPSTVSADESKDQARISVKAVKTSMPAYTAELTSSISSTTTVKPARAQPMQAQLVNASPVIAEEQPRPVVKRQKSGFLFFGNNKTTVVEEKKTKKLGFGKKAPKKPSPPSPLRPAFTAEVQTEPAVSTVEGQWASYAAEKQESNVLLPTSSSRDLSPIPRSTSGDLELPSLTRPKRLSSLQAPRDLPTPPLPNPPANSIRTSGSIRTVSASSTLPPALGGPPSSPYRPHFTTMALPPLPDSPLDEVTKAAAAAASKASPS